MNIQQSIDLLKSIEDKVPNVRVVFDYTKDLENKLREKEMSRYNFYIQQSAHGCEIVVSDSNDFSNVLLNK